MDEIANTLIDYSNQSIQLIQYQNDKDTDNTDDYGNPIEQEPLTINNVVVQPVGQLTGTNNNRDYTFTHVVFLYNHDSNPFPELDESLADSGKIIFNGKTYQIKNLVTNYLPKGTDVFGYEIEMG